MIFDKMQRLEGNFSSFPSYPLQPILTKIAIIDKRDPQISNRVYCTAEETILNTEDLQNLKSHLTSGIHHRYLQTLGTLTSLNKKNKLIKLANGQLIIYEYLIIVNHLNQSKCDDINEFLTGLIALIDALRIQQQKLSFLKPTFKTLQPKLNKSRVHLSEKENQTPQTINEIAKTSSNYIFEGDICLYEVQI